MIQIYEHLFGHGSHPHIERRTDSQAAIRVLQANGLQRKSRHVELRICFCQELIKRGTVSLVWVEGHAQIADILTKTLGSRLVNQFRVSMGFLEDDEVNFAVFRSSSPPSSSSQKPPNTKMSSMIRADGTIELKPIVQRHLKAGTPSSPSSGTKKFPSVLVEANGITDLEHEEFDIIIVEVCCTKESTLAGTAMKFFPANSLIIRCTKLSPLEECHRSILQTLQKHHQRRGKFSYVHVSLPCTGGSSLQNLSTNEVLKKEHQDKFFYLLGFCSEITLACSVWSFELPKRNNYWKSQPVQELLMKAHRPVFANAPKLCMCGGPIVNKTFLFATSSKAIASCLVKFAYCSHPNHETFNKSKWSNTGRYPERLVMEVLIHVKSLSLGEPVRLEGGFVMFDPDEPGFSFSSKQLQSRPIVTSET